MTNEEYLMTPRWKNPRLTQIRQKNTFLLFLMVVIKLFKKIVFSILSGNNIENSYERRNYFDKIYILSLLEDYRFFVLNSEGLGKKIPILSGQWLTDLDEGIAQAVFGLNKLGIATSFSCEGNHVTGHSTTAYISLDIHQKFPQNMIDMLNSNKVGYYIQEPPKNNPYRHGQCIRASDFIKDNDNFLNTLQQWAEKQNVPPIHKLKHQWKKVSQFT